VKENKTKPNIKSNIKSSIDELVSLFSKKEYNRVIEIYEFKSDEIVPQKAHLIAAKTYSKVGNFTLSLKCYDKYFKTINKLDEPKIHYEYGLALLRSKFYDRAIKELAPLLSNHRKFCPTPLIRALAGDNRLLEAITKLEEFRKHDPLNAKLIQLQIDLYKKNGDKSFIKKVENELCDINWNEINDIKVFQDILTLLLKISSTDLAIKLIDQAPGKFKKDDNIKELIAITYYQSELFEKALNLCEEIIVSRGITEKIMRLKSNCYSGLKDYNNANACLKYLSKKFPNQKMYNRLVGVTDTLLDNLSSEQHKEKNQGLAINKVSSSSLNDAQTYILESIKEKGYGIIQVKDLFDDDELDLWKNANEFMSSFSERDDVKGLAEKIENSINFDDEDYFNGKDSPSIVSKSKPSVISYNRFGKNFNTSDHFPKLFYSKKVLQIAQQHYNIAPKVRNITLWINPPISKTNQDNAKGSQMWHRDQEDISILKCFVYFKDLDKNSGALQYIPYSSTSSSGKYSHIHPFPQLSGYPGERIINQRVKKDDMITAVADKGSLVFIDTNGFHRGGLIKSYTRHIGVATYLRPFATSSFNGQTKKLEGVPSNDLSDLQKFAII
tara:strand:+ start:389 stop:2221 length:1833 start_codon:yes stop_codon:yes gene_type:complete